MISPKNWTIGSTGFGLMGGKFRKALLIAIDINNKRTLWQPINSNKQSHWLPFDYPHITIDIHNHLSTSQLSTDTHKSTPPSAFLST